MPSFKLSQMFNQLKFTTMAKDYAREVVNDNNFNDYDIIQMSESSHLLFLSPKDFSKVFVVTFDKEKPEETYFEGCVVIEASEYGLTPRILRKRFALGVKSITKIDNTYRPQLNHSLSHKFAANKSLLSDIYPNERKTALIEKVYEIEVAKKDSDETYTAYPLGLVESDETYSIANDVLTFGEYSISRKEIEDFIARIK